MVFRQENCPPAEVNAMIRAYVHRLHGDSVDEIEAILSPCFTQKICLSSGKSKIKDRVSWSPPPTNYFKVDFDGSKLSDGQAFL